MGMSCVAGKSAGTEALAHFPKPIQIMTDLLPYNTKKREIALSEAIRNAELPGDVSAVVIPDFVRDMLTRCWQWEPDSRPDVAWCHGVLSERTVRHIECVADTPLVAAENVSRFTAGSHQSQAAEDIPSTTDTESIQRPNEACCNLVHGEAFTCLLLFLQVIQPALENALTSEPQITPVLEVTDLSIPPTTIRPSAEFAPVWQDLQKPTYKHSTWDSTWDSHDEYIVKEISNAARNVDVDGDVSLFQFRLELVYIASLVDLLLAEGNIPNDDKEQYVIISNLLYTAIT